MPEERLKAKLYSRYPLSSIFIYNGSTILHYLLGGIGIILGFRFSWIAYVFGSLYLVFSLVQMYVIMPVMVCPNCVYHKMKNSLCISGSNVISKKIAKEGDTKDFPKRAKGLFSPNNLYMAALIVPIIAVIPALILNFSFLLLVILVLILGLLILRFFVIVPKIACLHCYAKYKCPQAEAMGVREM